MESSRADHDQWWRRSTDEEYPAARSNNAVNQEQASHSSHSKGSAFSASAGNNGGSSNTRRQAPLADTLSVPPPKALTIPEHPERMDSSGTSESYIQPKYVQGGLVKGHESFQVYAQSDGNSIASANGNAALQPRRRFGSGPASAPASPAAAAASAAAAALSLLPGSRRCSGDSSMERGKYGIDMQAALQRLTAGSSNDQLADDRHNSDGTEQVKGQIQQGKQGSCSMVHSKLNGRKLEQRVL